MPYPSGFSRHINMRRLERESRKILTAGFAFAVLFHCLIGVFMAFHKPEMVTRAVQKEERRIVADLIPIPPRPENPYLNWQGPEVTSRRGGPTFHPRMPSIWGGIAFKPLQKFGEGAFRFPGEEYGIDTDALIRAIVTSGRLALSRPVREPEPFRPEPYRLFAPKRNYWESPNRVSMKDEMLRIEDLNTGTYKGLVVLNPANERDIKGYLYIPAAVRGDSLAPPLSSQRSVAGLAAILKKHTGIIAFAEKQIDLSSPDILKYPFLSIAADAAFEISEIERLNLGTYLKSGGFAFIEAYNTENSDLPPRASGAVREMLRRALGPPGELRVIPNNHALYHCYFEFPDGPPRVQRENAVALSGQPAESLEGVWIGDRLAAVYSEKGYGASWSNPKSGGAFQNMGVNLVVFALTQAGGLTVRLVDDSGR